MVLNDPLGLGTGEDFQDFSFALGAAMEIMSESGNLNLNSFMEFKQQSDYKNSDVRELHE